MSELEALQQILDQAAEQGVAPGLVLGLWRQGREMAVLCAGQARPETVFDLASLTKPLATAPLVLDLVAAGVLELATTLDYFYGPAVPPDKQAVTLSQLLSHAAGYPAHQPYFTLLERQPAEVRAPLLKAMLLNEPLALPPGSRALYSDLGYMLLGLMLAEAGGQDLAQMTSRLYAKLEVAGPCFAPLDQPLPWERELVAPCGPLPGRAEIWGQVEDENAFALGGVAGHAGLFGSAAQVGALMDALCRAAQGRGPWPAQQAALLFTPDPLTPGSGRTLGFDTPSGPDSAAGAEPPHGVVGHLGYTGVSLWWHPASRSGAVLLSNRVALGRDNQKIKSLRPRVHQAAWQALGLAS